MQDHETCTISQPPPAPPLTATEVACYLGVSVDVVRNLIRKKKLRAGKLGGQWRIQFSDLADYLTTTFERF